MSRLRILVANQPRTYREVISGALKELCPEAEVLTTEPEELDSEIKRVAPGLVLCSCLTPVVENGAPTWVELYPGGGPGARIGVDGLRLVAVEGVRLSDLIWIADRAEQLMQENDTRAVGRSGNIRR